MIDRATIRRLRRWPTALLVAAAVVGALVFVGLHRVDRYVESVVGEWTVGELARRTDGVYRAALGDLSFSIGAGSISFDSAIVTTDTLANRRRPTPLPLLSARADGCRVSGIALLRLLIDRSLVAEKLVCDRMITGIGLVARARERQGSAADSALGEKPEGGAALPLGITTVRIGKVELPALGLRIRRPGEDGTSIVLEHARLRADGLTLDAGAGPDERALSADDAHLIASGVVLRPDPSTEITAEHLDANLADSTLALANARHEPSIPEAEWVRRVKVRRDRITFAVDSVHARGVAFLDFVGKGAVGVRALELRGMQLDVLADRRIPAGRPRRRRTPQEVVARPEPVIRLDTVLVTGGRIVYRERKPESSGPGVVSFDSVAATITSFHLPPGNEPLAIAARARLMGAGLLTVEARVPLDAPDFRYELAGRLGPMPATAFNRFLSTNEAFAFDNGRVEEVVFRQTARGGRATTTLTPRYRDLSVDRMGEGGGIFGSVKRAVEEFVAQVLVVRSANPDGDGKPPRTTRAVHRYDSTSPWMRFVWIGFRDALMEAMRE